MPNESATVNPSAAFHIAADQTPTTSSASHLNAPEVYTELLSRISRPKDTCSVVLFTSPHDGAGVTTTVTQVAMELIRTGKTVLAVDPLLKPISSPFPGATTPDPVARSQREKIKIKPIAESLHDLCACYDAIVVDGGSLYKSPEVFQIIHHTSEVVLIVEANQTTSNEVERATRCIRNSGGILLGMVMTKRRFSVPRWLSRFL
jgi:Mrp family chromosome partitioning ATPase